MHLTLIAALFFYHSQAADTSLNDWEPKSDYYQIFRPAEIPKLTASRLLCIKDDVLPQFQWADDLCKKIEYLPLLQAHWIKIAKRLSLGKGANKFTLYEDNMNMSRLDELTYLQRVERLAKSFAGGLKQMCAQIASNICNVEVEGEDKQSKALVCGNTGVNRAFQEELQEYFKSMAEKIVWSDLIPTNWWAVEHVKSIGSGRPDKNAILILIDSKLRKTPLWQALVNGEPKDKVYEELEALKQQTIKSLEELAAQSKSVIARIKGEDAIIDKFTKELTNLFEKSGKVLTVVERPRSEQSQLALAVQGQTAQEQESEQTVQEQGSGQNQLALHIPEQGNEQTVQEQGNEQTVQEQEVEQNVENNDNEQPQSVSDQQGDNNGGEVEPPVPDQQPAEEEQDKSLLVGGFIAIVLGIAVILVSLHMYAYTHKQQ